MKYPLVTFVTGVSIGLVAGVVIARRPASDEPSPSAIAAAVRRVVPGRRTICAQTGPTAAPDDDAEMRLRWCEARLAEKTREKPTVRKAWPEGLPEADDPDAWGDAMTAALAACGAPADEEVTDCEEFPCVVAMRPRPDADPYAAADALSTCLDKQLGGGAGVDAGAMVFRATCPDGSEEPVLIATGATDAGIAMALTPKEQEGLNPLLYEFALLGRRAESALQLWQCAPEPAE